MLWFGLSIIPRTAFAHHGKDFLVTSSYRTAEKGESFLLFSGEYVRTDQNGRGFEFEPGVSYGLTDRWSAEIHTHHELFDREFSSEAIGLETVYRWISPAEAIHSEAESEDNHSSGFSLATLFEFKKGINHAPDGMEVRLIGGSDLHPFSVVANLIGEKLFESNSEFEFRTAFGVKYEFLPRLSLGIETDSKLNHSFSSQITPGIYASLSPRFDLRAGASFPTDSQAESSSIHTTLIYSL